MKKVSLCAAACAMAFAANADVAEEVVVAGTNQSVFSSVYAGLGIGGSFLKSDDLDYTNRDSKDAKYSPKANRFMGSFVLGGGKVFKNNVYAGAEFLLDFGKKTKKEFDVVNRGTEKDAKGIYKVNGVVPQINVKAGYVFKNNTLAYAKLGCAWTKASYENLRKDSTTKQSTFSKSTNKASVVLGLGAEKAFCKKFSAALEGDYNFGWKDGGHRFNKGWNVRALVKYNVKY